MNPSTGSPKPKMNGVEAGSFWGPAKRWSEAHIPGGWPTLWIALGLTALAVIIWAVKPTANSNMTGFGRGGPQPVGVATVAKGDIKIILNGLGSVAPLATVTVRPQVTGILNRIYFKEGQMVSAGQLLAEIDPRPFQAALDQAKGQLARDEAQLANAKVDLERYQALWKQNAVSQQQLATQAAAVGTDEGTVKADEAAVEAAEVNLGYCRIVSPIAGRAGLRQVDAGNLVQAGGISAIVVITQLQPISVLFTLPEDDIDRIMSRVNVGAALPVTAFDRSQMAVLASGTLSNVDNQIDAATGTVKMRAMFDNKGNALFPSQFVNVKLLVDTLRDQVTVPTAAIQRGASGSYVYVIGKDLTVSMRTVTTGPADGDRIAIADGLSPGEKVVVDGADRLKDGARVLLPGMKPPEIAAGASHQWGAHRGRRSGRPGGRRHHGNWGGNP